MSDQQPSSAPDDLAPHDDLSAAVVMRDDDAGATASHQPSADLTGLGGTTPNSPIDMPLGMADGSDAAIERDARAAAARDVPEPHPSSQ